MPLTADPPFGPDPQGISLDELTEAFAQVMGTAPRQVAESPLPECADQQGAMLPPTATAEPAAEPTPSEPPADEDCCPISPLSILEAMLFVGNRDNWPLSPRRVAELMRDVEADDIPPLIDELNRRYDAAGAPYRIVGEADGYRLALRREFHPLRNRFYGRIREARLSQAAIDVLALVAYQQPISGEKVGRLRGKPSSHVLAHLVRRGLLRIERPPSQPRTPHYHTTERFLRLFNLDSLDDLPRSEDAGPP
jgi:segregation and condensation protein B